MGITIRNNEPASRYELWLDGVLASVADYRLVGDRVVFPHTETAPRYRGQGLAARLIEGALDDVRASRRTVVATCWFVAEFIDQHPEYQDLAARAGAG
jgi:predicted GNAT family acetyltransferase